MTIEDTGFLSPDELAQTAQNSANLFCLWTSAYLKEQGMSLSECWRAFGRRLMSSWPHDMCALTLTRMVAGNLAGNGGVIQSLTGDVAQAEVVIAQWPPPDLLVFFDLTVAEADSVLDSFEPIANTLGYRYRWQREGAVLILSFAAI